MNATACLALGLLALGPFVTETSAQTAAAATVAYVQLSRIGTDSQVGKATMARLDAVRNEKQADIEKRRNALQNAEKKAAETVMTLNEPARQQLQRDLARMDRDLQRATEEAEAELGALARNLQRELNRKVFPVIDQIATEQHLHFVFSLDDSGIVWRAPTVDLTPEVLKRLDAQRTAAPAPEKR
jgi:Skp family chaperone for outer membrane proteins